MPAITCDACGHVTNTAVSDWLDAPEGHAERCFVRWVDGVAEKGCAYERTAPFEKGFADKVIAAQGRGKP